MQSNHTGGGGQPRSQLQHGRTVTILITCHGAHNFFPIIYRASGRAVVRCPVWGLA